MSEYNEDDYDDREDEYSDGFIPISFPNINIHRTGTFDDVRENTRLDYRDLLEAFDRIRRDQGKKVSSECNDVESLTDYLVEQDEFIQYALESTQTREEDIDYSRTIVEDDYEDEIFKAAAECTKNKFYESQWREIGKKHLDKKCDC